MDDPVKITSVSTPIEFFEAGYQLMKERQKQQELDKAAEMTVGEFCMIIGPTIGACAVGAVIG